MRTFIRIGIDLAKNFFQVHAIEREGAPTVARPVGKDPADRDRSAKTERRLGHRIEDRKPSPLVELDSAGRVGRVPRKVGA